MSASAIFNGAALLAELRFVGQVCQKRSTIPILRSVLIDLMGTTATLTATNLDVIARAECVTLSGDARVATTAPADLLISALSGLIGDDAEAAIEFRVHDGRVNLAYDGCVMKIDGQPTDDYPTLPEFTPDLPASIETAEFLTAVRSTKFAITREEIPFQLNGALMNISRSAVEIAATDGHRLAIATFKTDARNPDGHSLIPRVALDTLLLFDGIDPVITFGERDFYRHFVCGHRRIVSRVLDVNFPNYRKVIAKDLDRTAIVNAEAMTCALTRVMPLVNLSTRSVRLMFSVDTLRLNVVNPECGEASATVAVSYSGPDMFVGMNATYLRDFFAQFSGDVSVTMRNENSMVVFRPVDRDGEYTYVLMPMRLA